MFGGGKIGVVASFNEELDGCRVQFSGCFLKATIIGARLSFENGRYGLSISVSRCIEKSRAVLGVPCRDFCTMFK
jgi:hypothetical protein